MSNEGHPPAQLEGVAVRFGHRVVLRHVDLVAHTGQVTVLVGPAGAGKTTLLRVLTGRLKPRAGIARLFGLDPRDTAARARLGIMLQAAALPGKLSVAEVVALHSGYFASPRPIRETLRIAGVTPLVDRPIATLSSSERRRVEYAVAISGHPDLLVLDAPDSEMDDESQLLFRCAVRREADNGTAVIIATRNRGGAAAIADRIVEVTGDGLTDVTTDRIVCPATGPGR